VIDWTVMAEAAVGSNEFGMCCACLHSESVSG
jgi:hypothetical protein